MNNNFVKYFIAVSEEGNMTLASKRLNITQPALSKAIKCLEDDLNTKLFIRSNNRIYLTEEGNYFLNKAKKLAALSDELETEMRSQSMPQKYDIYIGTGEAFPIQELSDCIMNMRISYPNLCFHLFTGSGSDITRKIDNGQLDFGICGVTKEITGYDHFELPFCEKWGLYVQKDLSICSRQGITPEDIAKLPLILPERAGLHSIIEDWSGYLYEELNVIATYNLFANVDFLVQSKIACILSVYGTAIRANNPNIKFLPLIPSVYYKPYLIWKKDVPMKKIAARFLAELKKSCEKYK